MKLFWKNKRVFVTGADGFIGSWLTKMLVELGAEVTALIRDFNPEKSLLSQNELSKVQVVHGKLEDFPLLERVLNEYEIDTVFHLAAQALVGVALRSPFQTFESNIRGTYNLLEACRQFPSLVKRILIASSDKAYGSSPVLPYKEDMPLNGRAPYEVSKSCADLLSMSYAHTYGLPVVIARCGNVYGGGDMNWSRIVPGTIRNLLKNESPLIRSSGLLVRDYLYVEDAVNAYLLMGMKADQNGVSGNAFNFGPEKPATVLEIVDLIQKMMNKTDLKPIILNQASREIPSQILNFDKASQILNWKPIFSLSVGLERTVEWYETNWAGQGIPK